MVEFAGKYQLVEALNTEEILKIAGIKVTEEALEQVNSKSSTLTVLVEDDTYTFSTVIGENWRREIRFVLGEPFVEGTLAVKKRTETTVTRDNNKLKFSSTSTTKRVERTFEFTDSGVTFVLDAGTGLQATIIYKRV